MQISHRGGHFLEGELGNFDAPFFSIGAAEATAMDPQHRLLLETTFRALENGKLEYQTSDIQLCKVSLINSQLGFQWKKPRARRHPSTLGALLMAIGLLQSEILKTYRHILALE